MAHRGWGSECLDDVNNHLRDLFNSSPSPCDELVIHNHSVPCWQSSGLRWYPYEFYVILDWSNRCRLLDCLNEVLHCEVLPVSLSRLKMFLLLKKGDPAQVMNYRGISLLNAFAKLFTALLARRIFSWSEEHSLLPECQAGFRSGRSCSDNLFVLETN